jgi:hypothetical protein
MSELSYVVHGLRVLEYSAEGPILDRDRSVMDLIGDAMANSAVLVVVPAARFSADFYQLRTGLAGDLLQKFVNYRLRLAIVGDLSKAMSESEPLNAFVKESNRGDHIWFLSSIGELGQKLMSIRTVQSQSRL